ncbi:MAG: type VI secretion system ATPase TssH [Planctomycetota bacterium]
MSSNALVFKGLIDKLHEVCDKTLNAAAAYCISRTHYNVEIEHWIIKLIDELDCDISALFRFYGVNVGELRHQLEVAIDGFKSGNSRNPGFSEDLVELTQNAWVHGSLEFGSRRLRSGHLLFALLDDRRRELPHELRKISVDSLREDMADVIAETSEAQSSASDGDTSSQSPDDHAQHSGSKTPALDQFTTDLTAAAREGKIDPVLGRDPEIRQIADVLLRRRQNNPILTGEAGVGKTAVVEGFARRIAEGDVPEPLQNVSIRSLDLGLLQAGAGIRGEFENRLKSVIAEVKGSAQPIILFIDEAHTMIGAGAAGGQGDAANLLKPALARGELRTIAATTWAEYKEFFEKDAALSRRFQIVKVEEPTESVAIDILRGLTATLEDHHKVRILDQALHDAVHLSKRYISGRQLPDKAISLLDTACSRVSMSRAATPPAIEDCQRRLEHIDVAVRILSREDASGRDRKLEIEEQHQERRSVEQQLSKLEERWNEEREIIADMDCLIAKLLDEPSFKNTEADDEAPAAEGQELDRDAACTELANLRSRLEELQGDKPMLYPEVDEAAVAEIVSNWTGVPLGRVVQNELSTVLELENQLRERVIGQDHALRTIAERIRSSRAGLNDPRKPTGVFLFVGPSGVGKTETAHALADLLYGGDQNMTVINMSEYKEEHRIAGLVGAPPGYVGYGKGGVLTEAVRRRPYSIVLLDEIEKAHPGVQDIFYQAFDKGSMRDGDGLDIDFKNVIFILTSNAGAEQIESWCLDPDTRPTPEALTSQLGEKLRTEPSLSSPSQPAFNAAFLSRTTLVPYYPLGQPELEQIARMHLDKLVARLAIQGHTLTYTDGALKELPKRAASTAAVGARMIENIIAKELLPLLSVELLGQESIRQIEIDFGGERFEVR